MKHITFEVCRVENGYTVHVGDHDTHVALTQEAAASVIKGLMKGAFVEKEATNKNDPAEAWAPEERQGR